MTISAKNKYMLFGAIGLLHSLFSKHLISKNMYDELVTSLITDISPLFALALSKRIKPLKLKRGRKQHFLRFISQILPPTLDDDILDIQEHHRNLTLLRKIHPFVKVNTDEKLSLISL